MTSERWGSYSVKDHTDLKTLIPELLLYDRLVMPVPASRGEKARWSYNKWDPDLLYKRVEQMGDLVIEKPWDEYRQSVFQTRLSDLEAVRHDAEWVGKDPKKELGYEMTRMILAQEDQIELPEGVHHVDVVAAFQAESEFLAEYNVQLGRHEAESSAQAILFRHQLAIPDLDNIEESFQLTIDLAKDGEFRKKRQAFYDWQRQVIDKGYKPQAAVEEMKTLVEEYNQVVQRATNRFYLRSGFTLSGIALGLAGSVLFNPVALSVAALALVEFTVLDRKPEIPIGPAAMFHAAESQLGLHFIE